MSPQPCRRVMRAEAKRGRLKARRGRAGKLFDRGSFPFQR